MKNLIVFLLLGLILFLILREATIGKHSSTFLFTLTSSIILILIGIKEKTIKIPLPFTLFYLLFLFWLSLALIFSRNIGVSIWEVIRAVSFFFLFISAYNLFRNYKEVKKSFLTLFVIFGFLLFLKDFYSYFTSGRMVSGGYFIGTFYWHNQMAGFLLFLIPLVLNLVLITKKWLVRFSFSFLLILTILGMIFTYSRGGWLSLLGGLMFFGILAKEKIVSNLRLLMVVGGVIVFLIVLILTKPYSQINRSISNISAEVLPQTRTVSGELRVTVWQNSARLIQEYPIFGVGPGAFGSVYYVFQRDPWLYASNAHNYFLEIAAETGIPGLLFFSSLLIFTIYALSKNHTKIKNTTLLTGVIAALFGSFLHAFIDFDWSYISLFLLFWIFLAFVLSSISTKEKAIKTSGFKKVFYLLPVILMMVSWLLFLGEKQYKLALKNVEKDPKKAEKYIAKAIFLNPFDATYRSLYGAIYAAQGKYREAKISYEKAIELYPFGADLYYNIGLIEFEKKNYKEAEKWLLKAAKLAPHHFLRIHIALSQVYKKLGRMDLAKKVLREVIYKRFPINRSFRGFEYILDYGGIKKDLARIYLDLIALDFEQNEKEEAKSLLRVVEKDLDPQNPLLPVFKKALQR